jgi:deoxycytidylate deaminase
MTLSRTELRWLVKAVDVCDEATHKQWRVGAVLVRAGRVISTGANRYRNDPALVEYEEISYHAEEVAIRRAGNAEGATIYVARITRSGKVGAARPCKRCQALLLEHRVHTAVWTEPYGWGKQKLNRLANEELSDFKGVIGLDPEVHPLFRG